VIIWEIIIYWWFFCVRWGICDKINKDKFLPSFGGKELEIGFLEDYDPMGKLTIEKLLDDQVLHNIGICYDFGGLKKDVMAQILD
jgi:hypothetical protein